MSGILAAPLQQLNPVPAVLPLLVKVRTSVTGGGKVENHPLMRSQNTRDLGTLRHFFKPQETTMGLLTVRNQELHERFLGIALEQQCPRSIYCVTIYHTHLFCSQGFFLIELYTDGALYMAKKMCSR